MYIPSLRTALWNDHDVGLQVMSNFDALTECDGSAAAAGDTDAFYEVKKLERRLRVSPAFVDAIREHTDTSPLQQLLERELHPSTCNTAV